MGIVKKLYRVDNTWLYSDKQLEQKYPRTHNIISLQLRRCKKSKSTAAFFRTTAASHGCNPGQDFPIRVWATEKLSTGTYGLMKLIT